MEILLVCTQGMSTNMLADKMKKASIELGDPSFVKAVGVDAVSYELSNKKYDVVLIGPQAGYMQGEVKEVADRFNLPCAVINFQDYGQMRAKNVLMTAKNLINNK